MGKTDIEWLKPGDEVEIHREEGWGLFELGRDVDYIIILEDAILGKYREDGALIPAPGFSVLSPPDLISSSGLYTDEPVTIERLHDVVKAKVLRTRKEHLSGKTVLIENNEGFVVYEKYPEWIEVRVVGDHKILGILDEKGE